MDTLQFIFAITTAIGAIMSELLLILTICIAAGAAAIWLALLLANWLDHGQK